jgi:hypothetical protein
MTLLDIVIVLGVIGVIMWIINAFIPMGGGMKGLINLIVFVVVLIWVLRFFGIIIAIPGIHVPPLM